MRAFFSGLLVLAACSAAAEGDPSATPDAQDAGTSWHPSEHDAALPPADAGTDAAREPADEDAGTTARTTVRVHYAGNLGTLTLRGAGGALSWDAGVTLTPIGNDTFEWSTDADADLELKPLLDDAWSLGPNYHAAAHTTVDLAPRFVVTHGSYEKRWPTFTSAALPSTRGIWVYYPPTYLENTAARFDVLYMHDGQNLFSVDTAFGGHEWQVDETLDQGAADGSIRETVVVGIENTPDRIDELTPSVDQSEHAGGQADAYLAMVTGEIIPLVNGALRTRTGREHTALVGSSLGGLCSIYAGVHDADVFGLVGAMSPSTWWDDRMILGEVAAMPVQRPARIYVDSGNAGPSADDVENTADLAQALRDEGYVDGTTLDYVVADGAEHDETAWASRLPAALAFLLGPR